MVRRIGGIQSLLPICGTSGSVDGNKLRLVHGRECHDDDLDRVENPPSALGS